MRFSIPALIFFHVEEIPSQEEIEFALLLAQPAVSLVVRSYSEVSPHVYGRELLSSHDLA